MAQRNSLISTYLLYLLAFAAIPVVVLGYLWITTDYQRFEQQTADWSDAYVESRRDLLRREVDNAVNYIDFKVAEQGQRTRQELNREIRRALVLLRNLRKTESKASRQDLLQLAADALAPQRFFNEQGFYYLIDNDGRSVLPPVLPNSGQRMAMDTPISSIWNQVKRIRQSGDRGYFQFRLARGGGLAPFRNVSFVYHYRPLDVYVVAGVYEQHVGALIREEVRQRLAKVPTEDTRALLFVTDLQGQPLLDRDAGNGAPEIVSWLNASEERSGMIELAWKHPARDVAGQAFAYVHRVPDWEWVVAAAYHLDELNGLLAAEEEKQRQRVWAQIRFILLVAIGLLVVALVVSRRFVRTLGRTFSRFQNFFDEASNRLIQIDLNKVDFAEFEQLALQANVMVEARNSTERELKRSEQRFQMALDAAQNDHWELNLLSDEIVVGSGFFDRLGYAKIGETYCLEDFERIAHVEDRDKMAKAIHNWTEHAEDNTVEFRVRDSAGNYHWIFNRGDIVESAADGTPLRAMGIMSDISERKTMEQALVQARIEAEDASHAKSQFLSSVSHELRTPLNGVLGYTQLLLRETDLPAEHARQLSAIDTCARHLLTLINDVLDLAKIESGNMEVDSRSRNMPDVVRSVGDIVRHRAEGKGLKYIVEYDPAVPEWLKMDLVKTRQVLVNLLDNAVKFSETGSVTLRVIADAATGTVRFEVQDTGMGIPADKIDEVFEPFRQVNPHEGVGTGLGLSICFRLCEAMGDGLKVSSVFGEGTCFSFTIPLLPGEPGEREMSSAAGTDTLQFNYESPINVLVVDDNITNRQVLGGMLKLLPGEVYFAECGESAIAAVKKHGPQLMLLDLKLPDMDGIEVLKALKEEGLSENLQTFMITAALDETVEAQARELGCREFMSKPIPMELLLTRIADVFGGTAVFHDEVGNDEAGAADADSAAVVFTPISPAGYAELETALEIGDIQGLKKRIALLAKAEPALAPVAERALELLNSFDLEGLKSYLRLNQGEQDAGTD